MCRGCCRTNVQKQPYRVPIFISIIPVTPSTLKEKIKLEAEGQPVQYTINTLSDDSRISLTLQGIKQQDKDIDAKVVIEKGIVPKGGTNATKEDISSPFTIPSPFNLVINQVSAEHDGLTGIINVAASQQISMDNISSLLKIDPAVKFTVEQTNEGFAIKSDNFNAEKTYLLTHSERDAWNGGRVLMEQSDHNIAFGEVEPGVRFTTNKSVYLSAQGNRMIEMRIMNVANS